MHKSDLDNKHFESVAWTGDTCVRSKMPLIDDDGTDGSSFVWTIQNFSYCLQKPGEWFDSPSFILDTYETDRWRLRLWPRGSKKVDCLDSENTIALGLSHERNSTSPRKVHHALSIRNTRSSFKKLGDIIYTFVPKEQTAYHTLLMRKELRKGAETFLDNDTMTLRCRIWKVDDRSLAPGQCYVRTLINVERATHIWSLEKFCQNLSPDELTEKQPISPETQPLVAMKLICDKEDSFSGEGIKLVINQTDKNKPCFLTCDLSLLEASGKVIHSMREEHQFSASRISQVCMLPCIPLSKLLDYDKPYLRCEIAVSSGIEYNKVERVDIGKTDVQRPNLSKELDFDDSLKDDLQRFYSDGMFTDFIIRTPSKDFLVHKAILCARSNVFHAMFQRDMKENTTGVVVIEDIDADAVHKMLLFAYSDIVEDLDYDVASKLYFAADKYIITALRRRCSDFLKENLSVSNVCEVSVLADMHQDEDLKSFAQDFIMKHAAEVMPSEEWKSFMHDHVHLASGIMHMLFLRNLNI